MLYIKQLFNSLILMEMEWLHLVRTIKKKLLFLFLEIISEYFIWMYIITNLQTSSLRWWGKLYCIRRCPLIWIVVLLNSILERIRKDWSAIQSLVSFCTWVCFVACLIANLFVILVQKISQVWRDNYEIYCMFIFIVIYVWMSTEISWRVPK